MTTTTFDFEGIDFESCSLCGHNWDYHDTPEDKCFVACSECRYLQTTPLSALPYDEAWRLFMEGR